MRPAAFHSRSVRRWMRQSSRLWICIRSSRRARSRRSDCSIWATPASRPLVHTLVARKRRSATPTWGARSPTTVSAVPYIGDESITRPPSSTKRRRTSASGARSAAAVPTSNVCQVPSPTVGTFSPLEGMARSRIGAAAPILERAIPSSGEKVPTVGLGTWHTFDVGTAAADRAPLADVLRRFVELGGRVIDSSPMYGTAETVVGDLAPQVGVADRLFLATKVWTSGREAGVAQMEQSLRRLRARRLDLIQIHNLLDWRTHLKTLREWKAAGRIRYLGVTHYTSSAYDELERVLRAETLDFVQVNYSIGEREAERRILPLARDRGVAVLVNRPFAEGGLFQRVRAQSVPPWAAEFDCDSWAQFFLKWILADPAVTCAIPGTSRPQHLADNLKAAMGKLPDQAMRDWMAAHVGASSSNPRSCSSRLRRNPTARHARPNYMKNSVSMMREPTPAGWDEALSPRPGLVMALFRARGSDAGDRVAAIVTGLAQASRGRVGMIDIDVNARPALAARYYVTQTPTILLLKNGVVVDRVIGTATRSLLEWLLKTRAPRDVAGRLDSPGSTRSSSAPRSNVALTST